MAQEGPSNKHWLRKLLRGEPHQVIGLDSPYLRRWYLIPRNPVVNLYLHQFLRSDDDRALHDHPWWFLSLILKGSYWEHRAGRPITSASRRTAGSVALRTPTTAHRVELERDEHWEVTGFDSGGYPQYFRVGREKPVWTVIITGPRVRDWGFHCKEWVQWEKFVHQNGCGEV